MFFRFFHDFSPTLSEYREISVLSIFSYKFCVFCFSCHGYAKRKRPPLHTAAFFLAFSFIPLLHPFAAGCGSAPRRSPARLSVSMIISAAASYFTALAHQICDKRNGFVVLNQRSALLFLTWSKIVSGFAVRKNNAAVLFFITTLHSRIGVPHANSRLTFVLDCISDQKIRLAVTEILVRFVVSKNIGDAHTGTPAMILIHSYIHGKHGFEIIGNGALSGSHEANQYNIII